MSTSLNYAQFIFKKPVRELAKEKNQDNVVYFLILKVFTKWIHKNQIYIHSKKVDNTDFDCVCGCDDSVYVVLDMCGYYRQRN